MKRTNSTEGLLCHSKSFRQLQLIQFELRQGSEAKSSVVNNDHAFIFAWSCKMHLVNTNTKRLETFEGDFVPKYAVLSHRWQDGEVTFQSMSSGRAAAFPGYKKVEQCCELARRRGIEYVWIDTGCIDKSSSTELSETLNSMFLRYGNSEECYVFLMDVSCVDLRSHAAVNHFSKSVWFTRGWTLQELIAPREVFFYNCRWKYLGNKRKLRNLLSDITRIAPDVLTGQTSLKECTVAQKMSWAADRVTTRVEDRAYSLCGLFNVHMPMLYGEGHKAFQRLQEEIIKHSDDQTIFAWRSEARIKSPLAPSPANFRGLESLIRIFPSNDICRGFTTVNTGLSIQFDLIPWAMNVYLAPLRCGYSTSHESGNQQHRQYQRACIFLQRTDHDSQFVRVAVDGEDLKILTGDEIARKRNKSGISDRHVIVRQLTGTGNIQHISASHYGFTFDFGHESMFKTGNIPASQDVLCGHRWDWRRPAFLIEDGNQHAAGLFRLSGISSGCYMYFGFDREFAPVCLVTTRSPKTVQFSLLPTDFDSVGSEDVQALLDMNWICDQITGSSNHSDTLVAVRGHRRDPTTIPCGPLSMVITMEWLRSDDGDRPRWLVTFRRMRSPGNHISRYEKIRAMSEISSHSSMQTQDPVERRTKVTSRLVYRSQTYVDDVAASRRTSRTYRSPR